MRLNKKPSITRRVALQLGVASVALSLSMGGAFAQSITIDFWDMLWGPNDRYVPAAQKLVDEYNAANPEVKVVYRSVPWSNWYETYVTAIASGSAPDLSTGAGFQAVALYDQGAIMPVDEVVAQMSADDFAPGALEAMKYDDHYVALPWAIDIRGIFYRKDLLEAAGIAPPTTWEEFRAAAKALTVDGRYGLVSSGDPGGMHWILASTINNGGGLFDEAGAPGLTSEKSNEALQFLADIVADGSVSPASVGYTNDDSRAAFIRGDAAFLLNSPGLPGRAGKDQDKIGLLEPLKSPSGEQGTIYWVNNVMVYNQTEHPAETMAFLTWWSKNQSPLWSEGLANSLPARTAIAQEAYFQDNAFAKAFLDQYLPIAKPMSASAGGTFPQLNAIDGDGFLLSLIQSIWQGQPLDSVVPTAQAHLEELMAD